MNWNKLDKNLLKILKRVGSLADQKGVTAYVVGGFVRDLILKRENLDIDIVLDGDAINFAQSLAKMEKTSLKVYQEFGTATLIYPNGIRVDFATTRKEIYSRCGALPEVSPGSIMDDLFRRDFTINAMAAVINACRFGQLMDIFAGFKDLQEGRVRIMHKKSFFDDPTRILRAVRFEQRFDFAIEPTTLSLLKSAIQNGYVQQVTPARYFGEFKKILKEAQPSKPIKRLYELKGLGFLKKGFTPDFTTLLLLERNIVKLRGNALYKNYQEWWLVHLMGLMESWTISQVRNFINPLNFTREEKRALLSFQRSDEVIEVLKIKNLRPRQVFEILRPLEPAIIYFIRVRTSANIVSRYVDDFLKIHSKVELKVGGEDLKRLGVPTGKGMGELLNELLLRKIDGKVKTRRNELKEITRMTTMVQETE
jgi:tRNA nucleotidyltransferase (CCA-adding enzyme)